MGVNYKAIADGDPGGELTAAFNTMEAETVSANPETRINYLSIANRVGFSTSTKLQTAIRAEIQASADMTEWVDVYTLLLCLRPEKTTILLDSNVENPLISSLP